MTEQRPEQRRLGRPDCKWCGPMGGKEDPPQWCRGWEGCPIEAEKDDGYASLLGCLNAVRGNDVRGI